MLRKLMIGTVAAVAIGFGAQSASAAPPIVVQPSIGGTYYPPSYQRPVPTFPTYPQPCHDHDYVVFVRHGNHWDRYGRFETLREAERAERFLESRGYRARIEIVEDRGRRW